ncbi:MAG: hypothetical protein EBS07_10460 [Sphingobacteriia bacterium]|nr:hypothetical protein [Sphingobacteriia bacterium]
MKIFQFKPEQLPGARNRTEGWWLLAALIGYLFLLTILITKNLSFLYAIPLGLTGIWLTLFYPRQLWQLGFFTMPLAIEAREFIETASLSIPSDLIAACLMGLFILRNLNEPKIQWRFLKHPISLLLIAWLSWMLITVPYSTMPMVSLKFFINALWYVIAFYTISGMFFKDESDILSFFTISAPPLIAVVLFSLILHGLEGFTHEASYVISRPFYHEHTVYGGSITLFFPGFLLLAFCNWIHWKWRLFFKISTLILGLGILFSYTRGAWLGLLGGCFILGILYGWPWIRKILVPLLIVLCIGIGYLISEMSQQEYREVAKHQEGLTHRLKSIFDVKTDQSNKERFNRWVAAWHMAEAHPITGMGPGTYAMNYAPFQESRWLTRISTNHGDNGTTHNEFLLATSEMGYLGGLLLLALYIVTLIRGIRGFFQTQSPQIRLYFAAATGGLVTYYLHAIVNNLMDQGKVAIPLFALMAIITSLDVYHNTRWKNRYLIKWGRED